MLKWIILLNADHNPGGEHGFDSHFADKEFGTKISKTIYPESQVYFTV